MQYVQNLLFYFIGDSLAHDADVCRLGWDEIGFFAKTFDPPSGVVRCPFKMVPVFKRFKEGSFPQNCKPL